MLLRSALIFLAFLALIGACTSEEPTPDELAEPTVEGGVATEQESTETGQATRTGLQGPQVGDEVANYCMNPPSSTSEMGDDPGDVERVDWRRERYIRWSPDGSRILFIGFEQAAGLDWEARDLYSVAPDGSQLDKIVDIATADVDRHSSFRDYTNRDSIREDEGTLVRTRQIYNVPGRNPIWGNGGNMSYFDVSPDSSHIVYSACAYTEDVERELAPYSELIVSDIENPEDTERNEMARGWIYNHEIALSDIDGGNLKRLTTNLHHDNFPVWSPDGSKIAFMTHKRDGNYLSIYSVATDRFDDYALPLGVLFFEHRMSWSPDGELIAFVGHTASYRATRTVDTRVYVAGRFWVSDDPVTGRTGIMASWPIWLAASGPAWSPDGQQIAIVVPELDGHALYTFAPNGTNPVLVTDNLPEPWRDPIDPWLGDLAWSPDGSEILLKGFTYRVPLDGSPPISSPLTFIDRDGNSQVEIPMDAAWSPDGSTLAVRIDEWFGWQWSRKSLSDYSSLVFMIDEDNSNIHPLVEYTETEESSYSLEAELRLAE